MNFKDIVDIIEEQSKERDQELLNRALKEIEAKIRKEGWDFPNNLEVVREVGRHAETNAPAYTVDNKIVINPHITDYETIKRLVYHEAIHQCDLEYAGHNKGFKKRCNTLNGKYYKGREYIPIEAEKKVHQDEVKRKNYEYEKSVKQEKGFNIFFKDVREELKSQGATPQEIREIVSRHLGELFEKGAPLSVFQRTKSSSIKSKAKTWATEKLKKLRSGQPLGTYKR